MEYIGKMLKKTGMVSIIESLVFIVLGIILIWKADVAIKVISIALGLLLIVFGGVKVVQGIGLQKEHYDTYNYELVFGLMTIIIGIVTMYYGSAIETILRIIIGIWIIYSSIIRASLSIKLKNLSLNIWKFSLILSVIMFILGMYVTMNSGAVVVTIGVMMIVSSILDIIEDIIFIKNVKEIF